jgi:hypothetical protein
MDMQHGHGHTMQHGFGLAAWILIMDMHGCRNAYKKTPSGIFTFPSVYKA